MRSGVNCAIMRKDIVALGRSGNYPKPEHNLIGGYTMDTLSSHASNGNPSSYIPAASGVYKIICTANKRIYIGSALNLLRRRHDHFSELRRNKHSNPHLQNAWNKYGEQAFIFEVLELVLPMSLTAREQYWFKKLKPFGKKGFNSVPEAGSNLGKKWSPEQIENMRRAKLGKKPSSETIEKMRQAHLGQKHMPETLEKMKGRKHTPEELAKMRQVGLSRGMPPEATEKARQANLGRKHTPEQIEKRRQSLFGNKNALGMKHTPEFIERMKNREKTPEEIEKRRQTFLAKRNKKQKG